LDIRNKCLFSDIRIRISEIFISDIQKTILDIRNKCLFSDIRIRISEIFISDIQNNYSEYQKLCKKAFGYQKQQFQISENKQLFRI